MERELLMWREKKWTEVGVLVAYLADRGGDMYHIKIWVYTWPGAFVICPGSSIVAEVMCLCENERTLKLGGGGGSLKVVIFKEHLISIKGKSVLCYFVVM